MTRNDVIFSAICGFSVAWIASDFFSKYALLFFIVLPVLSVFGLWVADLIARKYLFVRQFAKFALAGGLADVADIKIFQLLFWIAPFSLTFKVISFLVGTFVKYWCDKLWAFSAPGGPASGWEKKNIGTEMAKFFMVAITGSVINVAAFWFFGRIKTSLPFATWQELCVILAALTTAAWNFCGYKFIVFKK